MAQGNGRDHHMKAFSIWLAGGGIKGGHTHGGTDDLGYNAVDKPIHVNDLHATMLHLLGIDHTRLTYRFQGPRLSFDRRGGDRRAGDSGVASALLPSARSTPCGRGAGAFLPSPRSIPQWE
jgi:hypothetical protein